MIENYLLEELVTFAKYGTVAKTAEVLGLTQPAVTHSLKNCRINGVNIIKCKKPIASSLSNRLFIII